MAEYDTSKTGFFSQFPFGCFAWARLDEQLKDSALWQEGQRRAADGRDPLGLTASQPHVEFWNTELYGPTAAYTDVPSDDQHVFAMATTFFSARSTGTVELKSAKPTDLPVVQHNHLRDPLDMLVLSEGCRMANEIILEGEGTKAVVRGSWPANLGHHAYTKREEWESVIREKADTCKSLLHCEAAL
jgi:choline dehydrogenase-like flavoprotein